MMEETTLAINVQIFSVIRYSSNFIVIRYVVT
jgi:hypothetical protein